ncbi:hypothetical protein [Pseudolysinimonas sp.]
MTLQLVPTSTATSSEVSWKSPADGLWVATLRGEHAGMIERSNGSYHARSARGRALGSFPDLDSARAVVDGGDEIHRGAPRGAKALLLLINGSAVVTALALALLLIR